MEKAIRKIETMISFMKMHSKTCEEIAIENKADKDNYMKGIGAGMLIANKNYNRAIDQLESLVQELNGYMEEDIKFDEDEQYV